MKNHASKRTMFRALLIDDSDPVLQRLRATITRDVEADGIRVEIEPVILHIKLLRTTTGFRIDDKTIEMLAKICTRGFDYILSDFAFIGDANVNSHLAFKLLVEGRGVTAGDFAGNVLELKHLHEAVLLARCEKKITREDFNNIQRHFIQHQGRVLIYTNSPKPFDNYFDTAELPLRKQEIQKVFERASHTEIILLHKEFLMDEGAGWRLADESARRDYLARLTGVKLNDVLQVLSLRYMVEAQRKLRFERIEEGADAIFRLGLTLGAFSALCGEVIYHLVKEPTIDLAERVHKFFWGDPAKPSALAKLFVAALITFAAYYFLKWLAVTLAKKTEKIVSDIT